MLRLEIFLNRVNYSLYNILYYINLYLIDKPLKVLIFRPLYAIPFIRKRLKKNGFTTLESCINYSNDYVNKSMGVYYHSMMMAYVITSPWFLLAVVLEILIGDSFRTLWFDHLLAFVIFVFGFSLLISERFLWKNNRDEKYFSILKKEDVRKRIKWTLGTFLYCVLYAVVFILLLIYAETRLGHWK